MYIKSPTEYATKNIEIPSETSLKMPHCFVILIIAVALIKKTKISRENEIFLILSPCFFSGWEEFIRKRTEEFLERLPMNAFCSKDSGNIYVPATFFYHPVRSINTKRSGKKSFSQKRTAVCITYFSKIYRITFLNTAYLMSPEERF